MDDNKDVEVIPFDAIIKVSISGYFYNQLFKVAIDYAADKGTSIAKILKELQDREPKNSYEVNLITLLTLTSSIEARAKEQNLTETRKLNPSQAIDPES